MYAEKMGPTRGETHDSGNETESTVAQGPSNNFSPENVCSRSTVEDSKRKISFKEDENALLLKSELVTNDLSTPGPSDQRSRTLRSFERLNQFSRINDDVTKLIRHAFQSHVPTSRVSVSSKSPVMSAPCSSSSPPHIPHDSMSLQELDSELDLCVPKQSSEMGFFSGRDKVMFSPSLENLHSATPAAEPELEIKERLVVSKSLSPTQSDKATSTSQQPPLRRQSFTQTYLVGAKDKDSKMVSATDTIPSSKTMEVNAEGEEVELECEQAHSSDESTIGGYTSADDEGFPTIKITCSQRVIRVLNAYICHDLLFDLKLSLLANIALQDESESLAPFLCKRTRGRNYTIARLRKLLRRVPSHNKMKEFLSTRLISGGDSSVVDFVYWAFFHLQDAISTPVPEEMKDPLLKRATFDPIETEMPRYILKMFSSPAETITWFELKGEQMTKWAFLPVSIEDVLYLITNSLDGKVFDYGVHGRGLYLTKSLDWAKARSQTGITWQKSKLGKKVTFVALIEFINTADVKIFKRSDPRGVKYAGVKIPTFYYIPDQRLARLRYIVLWTDKPIKKKSFWVLKSRASKVLLGAVLAFGAGYFTYCALRPRLLSGITTVPQ